MKKLSTSLLVVGCLISSSAAFADNHTVSVGYAQSKIEDLHNMKGVNLQYRFESNFPLGGLVSVTYQAGDQEYKFSDNYYYDQKYDTKALSIQAGPVYRFNSFASIYGTVGLSYQRIKGDLQNSYIWLEVTETNTELAYGAGVIINPTNNLSVNVGYEGTRGSFLGDTAQVNGFNVGIGYRF